MMYRNCGKAYLTKKAGTAWNHLRHGGLKNTEDNLRWKSTW